MQFLAEGVEAEMVENGGHLWEKHQHLNNPKHLVPIIWTKVFGGLYGVFYLGKLPIRCFSKYHGF